MKAIALHSQMLPPAVMLKPSSTHLGTMLIVPTIKYDLIIHNHRKIITYFRFLSVHFEVSKMANHCKSLFPQGWISARLQAGSRPRTSRFVSR